MIVHRGRQVMKLRASARNRADYLNGGPDTDTCTRADTTAGCETGGHP